MIWCSVLGLRGGTDWGTAAARMAGSRCDLIKKLIREDGKQKIGLCNVWR